MDRLIKIALTTVFIITVVFLFASCSSNKASSGESRGSTDQFLTPEASSTDMYKNGGITIDFSNNHDGYIMIKQSNSNNKLKVQIVGPDKATYTYTQKGGNWETFPLTAGNGTYKIDVFTNIGSDMYILSATKNIEVKVKDDFSPYLYPNQYVWFVSGMKAMDLGIELSNNSTDDIDYLQKVYEYVTTNVEYDYAKANNVPLDYIPNIDETLENRKGICFDYAALMAALLRSQGLPTKLEVGYAGTAYHAWISVYTEETGWVDNIIEFDGNEWSLMDPTLASSNSSKSVEKYVGNGSNYIVQYNY